MSQSEEMYDEKNPDVVPYNEGKGKTIYCYLLLNFLAVMTCCVPIYEFLCSMIVLESGPYSL